jgi:putative transcriptional regulator
MAFKTLDINRENLTIMGVQFPNLDTLERISCAITSNMYEGYKPTTRGIEIHRDFDAGVITLSQLISILKKERNDI